MAPKTRKTKKAKKTRRSRRQRLPMFIQPPDHTIMMSTSGYTLENDTLIDSLGVLSFKLDDFLGYGNWKSVFDYYRINHVTVTFTPIMTQVQQKPYDDTTTGNLVNTVPFLYTAIDRDSNTSPVSIAALTDRRHRKNDATKKVVYKFTPTRLKMVYRTATTTGYVIDSNTYEFIDCANDDVPHYGLKYGLESASPARGFVYNVDVKASVSFAGKRG